MTLQTRILYLALLAAQASTATSRCPPTAVQALNQTLEGRVRINEPFALPCFSEYEGKPVKRDEALCKERQENYVSPEYRSQFAGAYMYEQSAICASDETSEDQCLLDGNDLFNSNAWDGVNCRQGNIPSLYIDVRDAQDAVEAFNYARESGGKLVIKNSGHSYVEDSSGKGALTLWTANLKALEHDREFVPEGCPALKKFHTVTTGAGVTCGEAYEYADAEEVTIICGYSTSVGLSGGWVQNGGHSVLTNVFGLGADRVVQYTVVTPDGDVRVANQCQNQDLFWALRGGGGGTFGVVIDSTHIVEEAVPMTVAAIGVSKTDKEVFRQWMDLMVDTALPLAKYGWGGHIYGNSLVHVNPLLTTIEKASESLKKIVEFAEKHNGTAKITYSPTWYSFFKDFVLSGAVIVGNLNPINTRLVPTNVFTDEELREPFKAYLRQIVDDGGSPYVPADSPYIYKPEPESTSVHPAWYSSLWELGQPSYWQWNSTLDERIAVARNMQKQTAQMEALTPGGGAYKNEANPFTLNWKKEWYGEHYEKLLEIKNKYDPDSLLKCWGCVGWTEEDARESCYSAFVGLKP
ncbi:6-hydroxy-D-nicotine oxidase [Paramyrothecium foliicola]|nr:6-hydroxy-D-nicotine oxidase [Paramyrothecium foliicola]